MSLVIAGLGTSVPEHVVEQAHAAELVAPLCCETPAQERLLATLYRRTGVRTRRSVLLESSSNSHAPRQSFYGGGPHAAPSTGARMEVYETEAAALALRAARGALEDAGTEPGEVTHLVTVSCTGFGAPGVDLALIQALGLSAETTRTHVGFMGCHGALNALRVADAFVAAVPSSVVLVCAVELCSLHHQYGWRPDQIVANALFADGAAAAVCRSPAPRDDAGWRVAATGSAIIPDSAEMMGWRVRDHGFEMALSPLVPELIHRHLRPWLDGWLARHNLTPAGIGSWAVHPGGPRILQACAEAGGFDPSHLADSQEVLAEYGNMSSPTVLFILDRLRRRDAPRPCVMLAFGPGLAIEAALIR